jgi:hypothetical protein
MPKTIAVKDYAKQGSWRLFFQSLKDTRSYNDGVAHIMGWTLLMVPTGAVLALLIVLSIYVSTGRAFLITLAVIYGLAFIAGVFLLGVYLSSAYVNLGLAIAQRKTLSLAELKTNAWKKMWYIFVVNFLVSLINQIASLIQIIPFFGAIVSLVLTVLIAAFMAPAALMVVDKNQDPIEAMKDSYDLVKAKGNLGIFVKMLLVFTVLIIALIFVLVFVFVVPAILFLQHNMVLLGSIWIALIVVAWFLVIVYMALAYQISIAKRYLQVKPA